MNEDPGHMAGIMIWSTARRLLNGKGKKSAAKWLLRTAGTPNEAKQMVYLADTVLAGVLGKDYAKLPLPERERWMGICEYAAEMMHEEGLTFEESLLRLSEG